MREKPIAAEFDKKMDKYVFCAIKTLEVPHIYLQVSPASVVAFQCDIFDFKASPEGFTVHVLHEEQEEEEKRASEFRPTE